MEFTVNQIAAMLHGQVEGNGQEKVSNVEKIQEAKSGDITFLANPKYEKYLYDTKASAIIVKNDLQLEREVSASLIRVEDPYSSFTKLLEEYDKISRYAKEGIEEPSFISDQSEIGENAYRGAFSYIGSNCKIGSNVKIYPHVFIGDNVTIGDYCILYPGVKIYQNTSIGNNCIFHAGVVIGSDGFGFAPQPDGSYKKIPQVGNVIIKDHVEIGANTVVDCATMGSTVVEEGVKLDNLVQLAHNVEIGAHTVIASQSGISGSTKIGERCVLAGQVGIVGHVQVADRVTIAAKSGLSRSIKEDGEVYLGYPAIPHKRFLKSNAVYKNLPELQQRVNELEKKVLNLPAI